jgi:hypothetical protein
LDENDTLGARCSVERSHFTKAITSFYSLKTIDPFRKQCVDNENNVLAIAEAWGYKGEHTEARAESNMRLKCSTKLLKKMGLTPDLI